MPIRQLTRQPWSIDVSPRSFMKSPSRSRRARAGPRLQYEPGAAEPVATKGGRRGFVLPRGPVRSRFNGSWPRIPALRAWSARSRSTALGHRQSSAQAPPGRFASCPSVAAYAGLAPTPWQTGPVDREQGVSKSGNPRLRTTLVQLAWPWLRHQPHSALTLWLHERARRNGGRLRKTTIVALARKLLVALWKYVTNGIIIEGAIMKTA